MPTFNVEVVGTQYTLVSTSEYFIAENISNGKMLGVFSNTLPTNDADARVIHPREKVTKSYNRPTGNFYVRMANSDGKASISVDTLQGEKVPIANDDFLIEVAKGNVPKHSFIGFQTEGIIDTTIGDIWGGSGDMVYPTSPETWEIISDDINDTVLGTGARKVLVTGLDENLLLQTEIVSLNGTTPVTLSNTYFRPQSVLVIETDPSGQRTNTGNLTLRDQATGNVRNVVLAGRSQSFDGHFTVPANASAVILQTFTLMPKNFDGRARTTLSNALDPSSAWITSGDIPVYQNIVTFDIKAPFTLPSGSDLRPQARVSSGTTDVSIIYEILLIEN